jgi:hypothetical protein
MDKYYLFIINNKKSILLSKSNSKTELRQKALDKIGDKIRNYSGHYLYRVKITKVSDGKILSDSKNKIKLIGGPMVAQIEMILIAGTPNKIKLTSNLPNPPKNSKGKIYFNDIYVKKTNGKIPLDSIGKLIWDWFNNKYDNDLFAVNIFRE